MVPHLRAIIPCIIGLLSGKLKNNLGSDLIITLDALVYSQPSIYIHYVTNSHVDHNILDCTEHHEPLQPYLSDTPEKVEGGNKDWNVLATCAIVRGINYAKSMGCEKEASNL